MAKIKNGFLDRFEGKLGPAVGYQWKGRACVRSLQPFPHNPQTPAQQRHRSCFRTLSRLTSDMLPVVHIGFRGPAREGQTSEYNCFMRTNNQCVCMVNDEVQVDYAALTVSVPFVAESGRPRDYVLLYAYAPALQSGQLASPSSYVGQLDIENLLIIE